MQTYCCGFCFTGTFLELFQVSPVFNLSKRPGKTFTSHKVKYSFVVWLHTEWLYNEVKLLYISQQYHIQYNIAYWGDVYENFILQCWQQ